MSDEAIDELNQAVFTFMRYFLVFINPILHSANWRGKRYAENQIIVLMALRVCGTLTPTNLSRTLSLQKGSLTTIIRGLCREGLVERQELAGDERSYQLRLTNQGRDLVRFLDDQRRTEFRSLFAHMDEVDIRAAAHGFAVLSTYLKAVEVNMFNPFKKEPAVEKTDWYAMASPEARREYDGFGPWLLEVRSPEDMPPRFRAWYAAHGTARFLIKFPCGLERRNAHPGMDLYTVVLAVHDDRLCLLSQEGETVSQREAVIERIQAIRNFQNLLQGELALLLNDGSQFLVKYNAVSRELIESIIDFLRAAQPDRPVVFPEGSALPAVPVTDFFYRALLAEQVARSRPVRAVHCENPGRRCRDAMGRRRRSLGNLILENGRELILVDRGKTMRRSREAVYAQVCTHIPFAAIRGVSANLPATPEPGVVRTVTLHLEGQQVSFDLLEPADGLIAALTGAFQRNARIPV